MWCKRCQQDVPAVAKSDDASFVYCTRCGTNMRQVEQNNDYETATADASAAGPASCDVFDNWQWDEELQEAERLIHVMLAETDDLAESDSPQLVSKARNSRRRSRRRRSSKPAGGSLLSTIVVGFGLSGLMCGGALLVWSHLAVRSDLWNVGLPVALAGQAVLVLGLLVQLYQLFGGNTAQGETSNAIDDSDSSPSHAPLTAYPTAISVHYRHAHAGQHKNDPWLATVEDDFEPLSDVA